MRTSYKIFLVAVVALMIATTTLTFGYWWSSVEGDLYDDGNTSITIGKGGVLDTNFVVGSASGGESKTLVPEGRVSDADDVSQIVKAYDVTWKPEQAASTVVEREYIKVTVISILNDGDVNLLNETVSSGERLFDISYKVFDSDGFEVVDKHIMLSDDADEKREVRIYISLREPKNEAQYLKVANNEISFQIRFELLETPLDSTTTVY